MTYKDKAMMKREQRARTLAEMGLVDRDRDRFLVSSPGLFAKQNAYEVRRDDRGRIRCSCLEFEEAVVSEPDFRCEHVMAVKFAVAARNTEPTARKSSRVVDNKTTESSAVGRKKTRRSSQTNSVADAAGNAFNNSAGSADGEQKTVVRLADVSRNGRSETVEAAVRLLANNKGAVNMRKNTQRVNQPEIANAGNVLSFRNTPSEGGEQLKFNWPSVGQEDKNGFRPFADCVSWQTVAGILDNHAPGWSHRVKEMRCVGGIFIVTVAITIDGVTREGIGTTLADSERGIAKAEFDAFKRAAVKFEFARDLEDRISGASKVPAKSSDVFANPVAQTLGELVTARQLGMIRMLAREKSTNAETECRSMFHCRPDELSKRAASMLIERLQSLTTPKRATMRQAV